MSPAIVACPDPLLRAGWQTKTVKSWWLVEHSAKHHRAWVNHLIAENTRGKYASNKLH